MLSLSKAQNEGYIMRVFVFRGVWFSSPLVCGESTLLAGRLAANQERAGSPQPLSLQAVTGPFRVFSAISGRYVQGTRAHAGAGVGWGRALVERHGRTREQLVKHLCVCRLEFGEGAQLGQGQDGELSPECCASCVSLYIICIMSAQPNPCFLLVCSL